MTDLNFMHLSSAKPNERGRVRAPDTEGKPSNWVSVCCCLSHSWSTDAGVPQISSAPCSWLGAIPGAPSCVGNKHDCMIFNIIKMVICMVVLNCIKRCHRQRWCK